MKTDDMAFIVGFVIGSLITLLLLLAIWDGPRTVEGVRKEAVRVGVARYVADKDGGASFTWILPAEVKP